MWRQYGVIWGAIALMVSLPLPTGTLYSSGAHRITDGTHQQDGGEVPLMAIAPTSGVIAVEFASLEHTLPSASNLPSRSSRSLR